MGKRPNVPVFEDHYLDTYGNFGLLYDIQDSPLHTHGDFCEFNVVTSGVFCDCYNGKNHFRPKNSASFYNHGTSHELTLVQEKSISFTLFLRYSAFEDFCRANYPDAADAIFSSGIRSFNITNAQQAFMNELVREVKSNDLPESGYNIILTLLLNTLISLCFFQAASTEKDSHSFFIDDLIYHFDNYDFLEIRVQDILKDFPLSSATILKKFEERTGKSIVEYRNEKRMELASQLLLKWNTSIAEVSMAVGITSISYFSKQFKKHFGVLPNEYRKKYSLPIRFFKNDKSTPDYW